MCVVCVVCVWCACVCGACVCMCVCGVRACVCPHTVTRLSHVCNVIHHLQGFIRDFQFGGGDVVCVNWDGRVLFPGHARNGAKSIVVSFC